MVIWFVIIKKGEFVEPILIGYKVLMITNTIAIYLNVLNKQAPHSVCDRMKLPNLSHSRTGWEQGLNVK